MGINRPAPYYAFGSKKEPFFRAPARYYEVDAMHTFEALYERTAPAVTEEYLRRSVEQMTDPGRPMGCFALQSALVCGPENRDVAEHMADRRREAEQGLRGRDGRVRGAVRRGMRGHGDGRCHRTHARRHRPYHSCSHPSPTGGGGGPGFRLGAGGAAARGHRPGVSPRCGRRPALRLTG
jgi:hypothetical protein